MYRRFRWFSGPGRPTRLSLRDRPGLLPSGALWSLLAGICLFGCTTPIPGEEDSTAEPETANPLDSDGDGYLEGANDCDDTDAAVGPRYPDQDGDGYGRATAGPLDGCDDARWADNHDDCDDTDAGVHPGQEEQVCDGTDDDCDGDVDEDQFTTYYEDGDEDGYGDPYITWESCTPPAGFVDNGDDCDDGDTSISPQANEDSVLGGLPVCDGEDNDCDGRVDETVDLMIWPDADGDGQGDSSIDPTYSGCDIPESFVTNGTDCDDGDPATYLGAVEIVGDANDEDCDGLETCYVDGDFDDARDATGTVDTSNGVCTSDNEALASAPVDCDDSNSEVRAERAYYLDRDNDGYGDSDATWTGCDAPTGYVAEAGDCDDGDAGVFPGADELWDGVDQDCDGEIDENVTVIQVSGGGSFSLALLAEGTVYAWGSNSFGQLGNASYTFQSEPVEVYGLTDIVAITAGGNHSLALAADGSVWAWGNNEYGQLGNGTSSNSNTPRKVSTNGGDIFVAIAAGQYHSIALRSDGVLWAWGGNEFGQLGDGTTSDSLTPEVISQGDIKAIAAGQFHSLFLTADGGVWAWGLDNGGQLGDGTNNSPEINPEPREVEGLPDTTTVKAIAAGALHSLALTETGDIWAWGDNTEGQLGSGTNTSSATPILAVKAETMQEVTGIAAGYYHSLALASTGDAWAWGDSSRCQLGYDSNADSYSPVPVVGTVTATIVDGGDLHSLALSSDGRVFAWGNDDSGQLGNGTTTSYSCVPIEVIATWESVP